jgi:hypothetical protein
MRASLFLAVLATVLFCPSTRAVDYSRVDRTIIKEPDYQKSPKYALLLFGKEAKLRVWVVLDGQTVYIDRNADGDLTGRDERFASMQNCRDVATANLDGKTTFVIKNVSTFNDKQQREFLNVDVEVKGPVSYRQYCGVELKGRASEAQVAHFHGPLTMGPLTVNGKVPAELTLVTGDKPTDLRGHIGTMNAEHGCWVVVRSHNGDKSAFPEGVFPVLDVEFPPKNPGSAPVRKAYSLDKFC